MGNHLVQYAKHDSMGVTSRGIRNDSSHVCWRTSIREAGRQHQQVVLAPNIVARQLDGCANTECSDSEQDARNTRQDAACTSRLPSSFVMTWSINLSASSGPCSGTHRQRHQRRWVRSRPGTAARSGALLDRLPLWPAGTRGWAPAQHMES